MEEYLTVEELSSRIKFSKQSLYNLINIKENHKGISKEKYNRRFILGKHYVKPTPKKILFKWFAILEWMGDPPQSSENTSPESSRQTVTSTTSISTINKDKPKSQIKI